MYSELHNPEHDLQREKSKASVTISISCFAGAIVGTFRQGSILIQYREGKSPMLTCFGCVKAAPHLMHSVHWPTMILIGCVLSKTALKKYLPSCLYHSILAKN